MKLRVSASVGVDEMDEELTAGKIASQAILLASVWANGATVSVKFNGTLPLVNGQPIIATSEGSTDIIDGNEIPVTFVEDNVMVNDEEVAVSKTFLNFYYSQEKFYSSSLILLLVNGLSKRFFFCLLFLPPAKLNLVGSFKFNISLAVPNLNTSDLLVFFAHVLIEKMDSGLFPFTHKYDTVFFK